MRILYSLIATALIGALSIFNLNAQTVSRRADGSKLRLGFNYGFAWQTSDIKARAGWGGGMTLEVPIIENDHSLIGVAARGRYLYAETWGRDLHSSTAIANNPALNGTYNTSLNYTGQGSLYQNHFTNIHDLDAELILSLNRLRARTGILLYVFGGLGVNGYKAKIDQLDISGSMYDYSQIGQSGVFSIKEELNLKRDHDYESAGEGSLNRQWKFAPALGIGYGVRLGRDVYIGVEYKVTFPRTDLLDGQRWNNNNTLTAKKDYWHYTSGFIRIGLGGGSGSGTYTNNTTTTNNTQAPPKPVIEIISPTANPSSSCEGAITAKIYNISSSDQITVYYAGLILSNNAWTYNPSSQIFTLNPRMITPGQSSFTIEARNNVGKRQATVTFNCATGITTTTPVTLPPTITIIEPGISPTILTDCNSGYIRATITNATFQEITVRKDGVLLPSSAYSFDVNSKILILKTRTTINGNKFDIQATNAVGSASASVTLSCIDATPVTPAPIVNITTPSVNPYNSPTCSETVRATVLNVVSKDFIRVTVNNVSLASQFFQYDQGSGQLTFTVQVNPSADILITATNATGMASDYTTITCNKQSTTPVVLPPTVMINNPPTSPYTIQNCNVTLIASTQNVSEKSNITIRSNNIVVPATSYTFDASSGIITFNTLNSGTQRYAISVYNSVGSAMDTTTIICKPFVPAPIVDIITPGGDVFTSRTCNENLTARLVNVPRKSMITVRVNNQPLALQQFNYDETTGTLTMMVNIVTRAQVSITANTEGGSAGDFITLLCEPPQPPTVSIYNPTTRPAISTTCIETVRARTTHIERKSQIAIYINGHALLASQFSFDSTRSEISFQTSIVASTLVTISVTNESGTAMDEIIVVCQKPLPPPAPVVQITKPVGIAYNSPTCNENILATVLNVTGQQDIQVLVNRRPITGFSWNPTTKQVSFNQAIAGTSHVVVVATNAQGRGADSIDIVCTPPKPKPTVNITNPTSDPFASISCNERVVAQVTNVTSQGIAVIINGQPLASTQYSFNATTGNVAFNVTIADNSKVVVIAQNDGGIAKDSITLRCAPPAPTVKISNPDADQFVSRRCNELISAKLTNVASKAMITLTINGQALVPQQFTYDEALGNLTVNVAIPGRAVLVITATNQGGTASDQILLTCDPPKPPTVTIFTPSARPAVSTSCSENIQARTSNVRNKTQIRITVNGSELAADKYRFDSTTSLISFTQAITGSTNINITVLNEAGTAYDETVIACQPVSVQPPPVVQITRPVGSPYASPTCNETVQATVLNVSGQQDIQVLVNNRPVGSFSYDATAKKVAYNNVAQGTTRVVVIATNPQGVAKDSIDIICSPPMPRPTVKITTPSADPYSSVTCNEHVVATSSNARTVSVLVNGQPLPSSAYSYNISTGAIDFNLSIADQSKVVVMAQNESGIAKDSTVINCRPPAPSVTITSPATTPYASVSCNEKIVAQLVNVPSKSMITLKVNGMELTADQFSYNETSGILAVNIAINGNTTVLISAATRGGSAQAQVVINCTPPVPPTVSIYSPVSRPTVSTTCRETVKARTQKIGNKSQIRITLNDRVLTAGDYTFDSTTSEIQFTSSYSGNTTVTITVTNTAGSATDQLVIACQPLPAPVVQISNPATNPFTSSTCNDNVIATVLNVASQANISVKVNSRAVSNFTYDATSNRLTFNNVTTAAGTSHIVISATNEQGSAADSVDITCTPPRPRPTVTISTPATDPFISTDCHENVVARVTNVTQASGVTVTVNGQFLPNDQYTFNLSSGAVTFNLTITDLSKVMITAQNESGMAKDSVTLKCQPPAPGVTITTPATTPYTSATCSERVSAQLRNVESADQISVRKDGVLLNSSQYTYTSSTGILQLQSSFSGRSTLSIRATTRGGTAVDSVTLVCAPPKPTVTITTPATTPYTSVDCSETIIARVTQVDRKEQINVRQDGVILPAANWTYSAGTVTCNTTFTGRVWILVEATTLGGSAKDSVLITCNPPKPRPIVNITSPTNDPFTTTTCKETISASLQNVSDRSQITVYNNGVIVPAETWTYSAQAGTLILNATPTGRSTYIIRAQNEGGSDADTTTLICDAPKPRPVVHITIPASDPFNSTTCQERVAARVNNVKAKSEITITLNGQTLTPDQFTFNGTDLVETNVSIPSAVSFIIKVANEGGQDADTIQLRCAPPPTVNITSPAASPYVSTTCNEIVKATVTNVESKNFISVFLNNVQISRDLFEYNPTTKVVTITVAVELQTNLKIVATNQGGTASDELVMQCRLPSNTPEITISSDCNINNSARRFTCSEGCTYTYSGSFNTPLTVETGQMICITGSYAGPLVMNGGILSVCGAINPTSISFNSGTILVTGSATFNHLVMNDPNSQILVYGSLAVNDGFVRGKIENFGSFSFQGQMAVNAGGIFKNYGELTLSQDVANNSIICNKGTLRITSNLNSSSTGKIYNYCKIYVGGDLNSSGYLENFGAIKVSGNSNFNVGTIFFRGNSKLITQNIQVNCNITGDASTCAAVYVDGTTTLNSSATISGKIDICDKNDIEVNNAKGNFTTNCECTVSLGACDIPVNPDDYGKVTICHKPPGNPDNGQTLRIPRSALRAHLDHGDSMGECPDNGKGGGHDDSDRQQQSEPVKDNNKGVFDPPAGNGNGNGNGNENPPKVNLPEINVPKINLPEGVQPRE